MLDLGFLPDVERLIAKTPETRQTMLFSATMPGAIVSLARTHMRHPMNIRAESGRRAADRPRDGAVHLPGARPGQARAGRPDPAGRELRPDDRVHPHQAAGAAGRRGPRGARLRRQPAARRHAAGRAREGAGEVPRGEPAGAGGHRRRRPRHRRRRRHPRHQLQLPRGREDLRPPDRPHRPCGRDRRRDDLRRLGRRAPGGRSSTRCSTCPSTSRRRPTPPRSTSSTTWASPPGTKGRLEPAAPRAEPERRDGRAAVARRPLRRRRPGGRSARTAPVATGAAAVPAAASPSRPTPPRRQRRRAAPAQQDTPKRRPAAGAAPAASSSSGKPAGRPTTCRIAGLPAMLTALPRAVHERLPASAGTRPRGPANGGRSGDDDDRVPTGANPTGRGRRGATGGCSRATAGCRGRRGPAPAAVEHRDVVEADGGVLAMGEPDHVPHRAGVVDADGVQGTGSRRRSGRGRGCR